MTPHLNWSLQLILSSFLPTPTLSQKSQKPFGCKHLIGILNVLRVYVLFFWHNDQPKFYYWFPQPAIIFITFLFPQCVIIILWVFSGIRLLIKERWVQRACGYTFSGTQYGLVKRTGTSESDSTCTQPVSTKGFCNLNNEYRFSLNEMGVMISTSWVYYKN